MKFKKYNPTRAYRQFSPDRKNDLIKYIQIFKDSCKFVPSIPYEIFHDFRPVGIHQRLSRITQYNFHRNNINKYFLIKPITL